MIETLARDTLIARASGQIHGVAAIPGDKSLSHRALILGALAQGETIIAGLLESDDVMRTAEALRKFGIRVERFGPNRWRVIGGEWHSPHAPIDCGNSGTAARLLIGAAAGFRLTATFTGDQSLRRRPMDRLLVPLRKMGARIEGEGLPLTLRGGNLKGIHHVNVAPSAQVKSAILLAGLNATGEIEIAEPMPSRDHTEIMLRTFGAEVETEGQLIQLGDRRSLKGRLVTIPADPSSAAFTLAAAAIGPGAEVMVCDMLLNPLRSGFLMALQRLGGDLALDNVRGRDGETIGDIRVRHSPLFGAEFTAEEIPSMVDEIPALSVMAATARGQTRIEGLAELRHKECDRLQAIDQGLRGCGVDARREGDVLIIRGGPVRGGATVDGRGDHRIAMAFLVLGLAANEPVTVTGTDSISTSFPGFAAAIRALGAGIDRP